MIKVSVVIPTFNRLALLQRCLQALKAQSLPMEDFEILVCDDGAGRVDTSSIEQLVKDFSREGLPVRRIPVVVRHGPAAARNVGWRAARAELIAFTDDDTIPDPHWLAQGVNAFAQNKWLAASGRTLVPLDPSPTDYEKNESGLARAEFITANCFCRRSALCEIGGFDENFSMAWREDSDLHFGFLKLGGEAAVGRIEGSVVIHPVRPASWGVSLKQVKKAAFNALLYKKHPQLYRSRIQSVPPLNYYMTVLFLLGFVVCFSAGFEPGQRFFFFAWSVLILEFAFRRLRHTRKSVSHISEMLVTSLLIPPLAVFWRLYGAWKFRVLFV